MGLTDRVNRWIFRSRSDTEMPIPPSQKDLCPMEFDGLDSNSIDLPVVSIEALEETGDATLESERGNTPHSEVG
jgi:hypothetical protein